MTPSTPQERAAGLSPAVRKPALPARARPRGASAGRAVPGSPEPGTAPETSPQHSRERAAAVAKSPATGAGSPCGETAPGRGPNSPAGASLKAHGSHPAGTTYVRRGVTLTATARCQGCDWTAGPGPQADVDKAAEKHTRKGHPTAVVAEPAGMRGAA